MRTLTNQLPRIVSAALTFALLAAAPTASAKPKACSGRVTFSNTPTTVVVYRGVTCKTAKRILRGYDKGLAEPPWRCSLSHAPFDRVNGKKIALSCGYGTGNSNLRKKSHAFVGTIKG